MNDAEIRRMLEQTFADHELSRGERQGLRQWLSDQGLSDEQRAQVRNIAFDVARGAGASHSEGQALDWLQEVLKAALPAAASVDVAEAHFSPGEDCVRRIISLFDAARSAVDVCVFTITDDRITEAILTAHGRGVALRIVTDNEKAFDPGSDVARLQAAGVPLRVDMTPFHMHHKFALFDRKLLLSGSYNWTRGAATSNEENLLVTSDVRFLQPFAEIFEKLWRQFA